MSDGDACSEAGVYELAGKVKAYWTCRGYRGIQVWVTSERARDNRGRMIYCVRSNIDSTGFPPKR